MVYEGALFVPKWKKVEKVCTEKKYTQKKKDAMSKAGFEPTDTPKLQA